jgi:FMN hydrolase / 5-amino-6-(5-phospho-D-ribitylamino)uracil phosphatase
VTSATPIVLFDVMGTLVHDPFYDEVPRFFDMTLEELIAVKHPTTWVEFELGNIDEHELARRFFADHRSFDIDGLEATMKRAYRLLEGIDALLHELARESVSMHAFSNYPTWWRMIEEALGLSRFLEWSFVSCATGHRKPSEAAYRHVLEQLERPADELVFVDDVEANCEGARRVGIHAIRFTDAKALRKRLVDLGVLGR